MNPSQRPHWFIRYTSPWLVFVPPIALYVILALPGWKAGWIAQNDRAAWIALRTIATAESVFRSDDLDGNKIQDYWTGDVESLRSFRFEGFPFIPEEFAAADAAPLGKLPIRRRPYHGYYFIALRQDDSVQPPEIYQQDTDGKAGKVHHRTGFAFCAYPVKPGVTGNYIYLSGSNYLLLSRPVKEQPVPTAWPPDPEMIHWNRCVGE